MSMTEVVTRLALRRQQQEIERQRQEIEELRAELAWRKRAKRELEEGAARKLALGINLNRYEAAAYLRTSPKTLQRWEKTRRILRCPERGTSVLYPASDVLRLASASSRKGA
jgi:DNA-binding transcriptional regulator YiaG